MFSVNFNVCSTVFAMYLLNDNSYAILFELWKTYLLFAKQQKLGNTYFAIFRWSNYLIPKSWLISKSNNKAFGSCSLASQNNSPNTR